MNVMITAHSGCDGYAMNSEAYIRHALSLPIGALEVDVRRDIDGGLVLTHNPIDPGQDCMTLREAFGLFRDVNVCVNCDLKEKELERGVLNLAGESGISRERVIFTGSLTDWRDEELSEFVWLNPEEVIRDFYEGNSDSERVIMEAAEHHYPAVNIDYRYVDEELLRQAERYGVGVSLWTVDDVQALPKSLQAPPIINITTNYPMRLYTFMQERGFTHGHSEGFSR
ncbi:MAG: glycerophosphodiester phosphodiesterase [Synergistaceae bacterium]|nr:glycerophosphodiester phosphodiesterase [Synergistaceae bacterium]